MTGGRLRLGPKPEIERAESLGIGETVAVLDHPLPTEKINAKFVVAIIDAEVLDRQSHRYVWGGRDQGDWAGTIDDEWNWPGAPASPAPPFDWHGWLLP